MLECDKFSRTDLRNAMLHSLERDGDVEITSRAGIVRVYEPDLANDPEKDFLIQRVLVDGGQTRLTKTIAKSPIAGQYFRNGVELPTQDERLDAIDKAIAAMENLIAKKNDTQDNVEIRLHNSATPFQLETFSSFPALVEYVNLNLKEYGKMYIQYEDETVHLVKSRKNDLDDNQTLQTYHVKNGRWNLCNGIDVLCREALNELGLCHDVVYDTFHTLKDKDGWRI